jgi:hypothetical protein
MADNLFGDLERQYGLPAGYLARTYQIESGSGQNLYNPLSKAAGGFQFIPSTAKQYGLKDPYDLAQSADAAARLAADNRASLQKAGIESPTAAQLYLAHQQGASGANKLLGGADTKATDIVGEKAVLWNAGKASMTGPEFADRIMAKFEGTTPAAAPVNYTAPWSNAVTAIGDVDKKYLGGSLGVLSSPITGLLGMFGQNPPLPQTAPTPAGGGGRQPDILAPVVGGDARLEKAPDTMSAGQIAGFAGLGNSLIAAGAPKMTWKPSGEAAPAFRGQWRDDIFAGLLGPRSWG